MTVPARYYRLDFRKLTLGECWRLRANLSGFWNLYLLKAGVGDPPALTECVPEVWPAVPADELPAEARRAMAPALRELRDAGYEITHYGSDPLLEPNRFRYKVLLLSDDRRTGGLLDSVHLPNGVTVNIGLTSRLSDGTFRITSTHRDAFRRYPKGHWSGCPGWTAKRVADRHLDNLDRWLRESRLDPHPYRPDEGAEVSIMLAKRGAAQLAERGLFVELRGLELEAYRERFQTSE